MNYNERFLKFLIDHEIRAILYEGTNPGEAREARRILSEGDIKHNIGFGNRARFQDTQFPILSVEGMDLYGLGVIERYFS